MTPASSAHDPAALARAFLALADGAPAVPARAGARRPRSCCSPRSCSRCPRRSSGPASSADAPDTAACSRAASALVDGDDDGPGGPGEPSTRRRSPPGRPGSPPRGRGRPGGSWRATRSRRAAACSPASAAAAATTSTSSGTTPGSRSWSPSSCGPTRSRTPDALRELRCEAEALARARPPRARPRLRRGPRRAPPAPADRVPRGPDAAGADRPGRHARARAAPPARDAHRGGAALHGGRRLGPPRRQARRTSSWARRRG